MYDTIAEQLASTVENIPQLLCLFEEKGLLTGPVKTVNEAREGSMFLQESAPENLELKQKIFKLLDELADDQQTSFPSRSWTNSKKLT